MTPSVTDEQSPDDLTRVEGIGPKIAAILQGVGVNTFRRLAAMSIEDLRRILQEADPRLGRLIDPTTWPEQARLAGAGQWDALKALQASLRAGRRARTDVDSQPAQH